MLIFFILSVKCRELHALLGKYQNIGKSAGVNDKTNIMSGAILAQTQVLCRADRMDGGIMQPCPVFPLHCIIASLQYCSILQYHCNAAKKILFIW